MTEQASQQEATAAKDKPAAPAVRPPDKALRPSSSGRLPWRIAGVLLVVLVLCGVWITWPLWSPALPGWLRGPLAPAMEAGRGGGLATRIEAVEKKLAGIEADIAAIRGEVAKRPAGTAAGSDRLADELRALAARAEATDRALAELRERAAHVEPMENRLTALDSAIRALSGKPVAAPQGAPAADTAALSRLQSDTAVSIATLQQQDRNLAARLNDAGERLAALEARTQVAGAASRETAFVLAVGQLREAVRSGRPFADALSGLRAIAGDDREAAGSLAALQSFAGSGVADLATLRARFAMVAPRIVAAAPRAGTGWLDQTLARLSNLVSIRRTGPAAAAGQGAEAAVARAEIALGGGDLAAAVKDLESLSGPAADAAAPWLAGARARIAADGAVAGLESIAIGRLGGAKGPGAPAGASGG